MFDRLKYQREWCKKNKEKIKQYYQKNKEKHNIRSIIWAKNNPDKVKKYQKKYYNKNKETRLKSSLDWAKKNKATKKERFEIWLKKKTPKELKEYYTKTAKTKYNNYLKNKYGITSEEYNIKFKLQGFKCAICKKPYKKTGRKFHVDHDHANNKIRDILCFGCNSAIGMVEENIETLKNMIKYLKKHKYDRAILAE